MILIALLIFIILLAGIIFIGLILMSSYGGGEEVEAAPLLQFTQWIGEVTTGILVAIAEWINQVFNAIEGYFPGM